MQLVFTDATSGLPLVESTFLFTTASTLCFLAFTLPYELRAMAATGGFAVIAQHPATFASVALLGAAVNFLSYGVIHSSSGVSFKVIGQAKNGALVVGSALFLGDPLSPVEITGYVASLAGVGLYTHAQSAEKAEARKLLGGGALDVAPERQQHGGTGQPAEEEAAGPQLEEDQFVDTSPVSLGWLGDLFCPCLPRTPFSQLVVLSASSIVAATGFSALQESVFSLPGFTFPSFVTFVTSGVYCLCGALEMMQTGELRVTSSWRDYAILASLTFTGMYLTKCVRQKGGRRETEGKAPAVLLALLRSHAPPPPMQAGRCNTSTTRPASLPSRPR